MQKGVGAGVFVMNMKALTSVLVHVSTTEAKESTEEAVQALRVQEEQDYKEIRTAALVTTIVMISWRLERLCARMKLQGDQDSSLDGEWQGTGTC
eukprot:1161188-Pelagomonas_calceolata.AAC.13